VVFPDDDEHDGFDFEPSEHEPDEPNPEADLYDSSTDSLTIPQVEADPSDADPEMRKQFWTIVLLVKGAVLTLPLGILFIALESNTDWGLPLVAVGGVLGASALYRFYTFDPASVGEDDVTDPAELEDAPGPESEPEAES